MAHETGTSSFSGLTVPEFYSLEDFEELGGGADFNPLIVNALSFASFGKDPAAVTDANVLLLSPQEAHFHPQHGLRDHVAPGYLSCAEIPAGIEPRKLERSTNNREDLDCEVTSTSASTSASPASVSGGDLSDEEHETDCYLKMDDDSDDEFIHSQGAGSAPVFSPKKLRSGVSYALGRGPISVPGKSWSFKPARQTKRVIAVCQGKNNNDDGDSSQIFHFQKAVHAEGFQDCLRSQAPGDAPAPGHQRIQQEGQDAPALERGRWLAQGGPQESQKRQGGTEQARQGDREPLRHAREG